MPFPSPLVILANPLKETANHFAVRVLQVIRDEAFVEGFREAFSRRIDEEKKPATNAEVTQTILQTRRNTQCSSIS